MANRNVLAGRARQRKPIATDVLEWLPAWRFDAAIEPRLAARVVLDQLDAPDLQIGVVSRRGDEILARVLEGEPPHPATVLYIGTLGLFRLVATDTLPACASGGPPVTFLTLRLA